MVKLYKRYSNLLYIIVNAEFKIPHMQYDDTDDVTGMFEIARFLSKEIGLEGKSIFETEQTDILMDYLAKYYERKLNYKSTISIEVNKHGSYIVELEAVYEVNDVEDRKEVILYFLHEFLPQFLDTLELLMKNSEGLYLSGKEVIILH